MKKSGEKVLPMSSTNVISINALLKKGLNLLEIKRIGLDDIENMERIRYIDKKLEDDKVSNRKED
jgi:hypothetical protein